MFYIFHPLEKYLVMGIAKYSSLLNQIILPFFAYILPEGTFTGGGAT
jgi:hypothetical protein